MISSYEDTEVVMNSTPKILFLSHYFPPEVNAPANRTFEHARIWVENGAEVTVMTNVPNHPHGTIFGGYENHYQHEKMSGINVFRLKTYLTPNAGFFKRIMNYIVYMVRAIWFGRKMKDVDVIIATSPQFFCGIAGAILSKILNKPFILEIRDIWPESIISVGMLKNSTVIRILESIESWMVLSSKKAVAVTKGIEQHLQILGHQDVIFIPNGVLVSRFGTDKAGPDEKTLTIAYFGTIGLAHNVEIILKAAERLGYNKKIKFIIAGDGSERKRIEELSQNLDNMTLYPLLTREELISLFRQIDVGIVPLKDNKLFQGALPSKMFEYFAMTKAVILSVPEGEATQLVRENNCGLITFPENDEDLAHAIEKYANNPDLCRLHGVNGRELVNNEFDREQLAQDLLQIISSECQIENDESLT